MTTPQLDGLYWIVIALFGALTVATALVLIGTRSAPRQTAETRRASLTTWWILASLLTVAVFGGRLGVCVFLGVVSWISLREYRSLAVDDPDDRATMKLMFGLVPCVYVALFLGQGPSTLVWLPFATLFLAAGARIARGRTDGYLEANARLVLGPTLLIFGPAHAVLLLDAPSLALEGGRVAGWFVYLVLLTEISDIAQAHVGRRFGRRAIAPVVSPNKTVEGLLGGYGVTLAVSILIAPHLTTLPDQFPDLPLPGFLAGCLGPALAALVITTAGFLGDLNLSAIKRDLGVKDSSELLPGMGGALDRIDSLTLSAPCFYWLIVATLS